MIDWKGLKEHATYYRTVLDTVKLIPGHGGGRKSIICEKVFVPYHLNCEIFLEPNNRTLGRTTAILNSISGQFQAIEWLSNRLIVNWDCISIQRENDSDKVVLVGKQFL